MNTFVCFNECVLSHASQSTTADLVPKVCAGGMCKIIGGILVNASAVHRIMPIPCTYPHIPHPTKYNENVVAIVRTYHNTHDLGYHIQSAMNRWRRVQKSS